VPLAKNEKTETLPDGSVVVDSPRGFAHMSRLRAGVVLFTCRGIFPTSFYDPMVAMAQREMDASGSLVLIVDGWDLASVETGYREAWTVWFKKYRKQFRMTLLVRSKMMVMAARLANLFSGSSVITIYSDITAWQVAARRDMPGFQRMAKAAP
jgi:hypothetical protein